MNPAQYAKAIIAVLGAGITAALGIVPADGDLFSILTIAAAVLTAAGVYLVPNGGDGDVPLAQADDAVESEYESDFEPKHRAE